MTSTIDGLISGLQTTTVIAQLMAVEALPQKALKDKVTASGSFVTALQALNSKIASLGDSAKSAATATSWSAVKPASSATSVTAAATPLSQAGSLTFSVDAVATRQTSVSAAATDLAGFFGGSVPAALTLATGAPGSSDAPTLAGIDLTGVTDLAGLVSTINKANVGVTATLVKVNATQSRVQLTGTATGVAAAFDLYNGSVSVATIQGPPPLTPIVGHTGATAISAASDASLTLWKGTAAQQVVTSGSNTFTGLMTGVDLTVSKVESDPVTVTVARDGAALSTLASGLVTNLALVFSEIASQTKATTTTDSTGRTRIIGGVLSADSAVRDLQQSVLSAASDPINGVSPSTVGLVLGKDGTITFDQQVFSAAMTKDPTGVQAVISGLAARVQTVATGLSDPTTGLISLKIQGQQRYVKTLNDQVSDWDARLALKQTGLNKTYANLEVALGKLKDQSDWLASQLSTNTSTNG